MKFVSHNLMGPHVRQIKRLRAQRSPEIALEVGEAAVADVLVPLLFEHDLHKTPGGICEDGTTANRKLDWERVDSIDERVDPMDDVPEDETYRQGILARDRAREEVLLREHAEAGGADFETVATALDVSAATWRKGLRIWGLVSGTGKGYIVVHSLTELLNAFKSKRMVVARYVYIYTWVPTAKHAPWFPFIMLASDNKFTGEWAWRMWRKLHKACAVVRQNAFGIARLPLTWHGSDGDTRMRLADFTMNLYANRDSNDGWCTGSYHIDHPLFIIHVPRTAEGLALLACQDLVHLIWRWRRQLLDDKKTLHLHKHRAGRAHLKDVPWISASMLDYKNKQDWPGAQAIFSKRTCTFLEQKIAAGEDERRATYLYCLMGQMLMNAWLAEAEEGTNGWTPSQSIEQAACVLAHTVIWRNAIDRDPELFLAHDCQTRETIIDTYTSCATCILRFPLYRDDHPSHKPYGPNFGQSRFSEYGFQKCRMHEATNSPSLSVFGFYNAFKHTLFQISLEARSLLRLPDSRRGVQHSVGRVEPDPPSAAYRQATRDGPLLKSILAGFEKAVWLWKEVVYYNIDVNLPGFFAHPWKHFNLPSELKLKTVDGKEDGEELDEVVVNSQDADDAAELMGRMIEDCAVRLRDVAVAPEAVDLEIARALGGLFRGFNSQLSEEHYNRKHRFRTDALLKEGEEEASTLKEDGALVAVFEREDGSLYWLPGWIEELRVATNDLSDERITSDQLQRVEKRYVEEVAVNDSRGIYLIRWYVEVGKDGKDLKGYGNRGCMGYRLTSDNNSEPFRWLSNYQVLAPVQMVTRAHAACKMAVVHANDLRLVKQRFEALTASDPAGGSGACAGSSDGHSNSSDAVGSRATAEPAPHVAAAVAPVQNRHATAAAAEAEKEKARQLAATLRKAARSESLGRREEARAAQLREQEEARAKRARK